MDIIPPKTAPSRILLDSPMPASISFSQVLKAPTGGFTRNIIIAPIARMPRKGYSSTGLVPSRDLGEHLAVS